MRIKPVLLFGLVVVILLSAVPLRAAPDADTTVSYPERRRDRNVVENILAAPSFVLKLPFKVVGGMLSGPVILVERQSLLPTIEEWLRFVRVEGISPVMGIGSKTGLVGGLSFRRPNLFAEGIGFGIRGSYSTNMYRFSSLQIGGANWGNSRFGVMGEFGWRADTRERFEALSWSTCCGENLLSIKP